MSVSTLVSVAEPQADEPPRTVRGRAARARALSRQLAMALLTILLISFISFFALNHSADQLGKNVLGRQASRAQLDAFAASRGLDRPLIVQYLDWLWHFVRGDWGTNLAGTQPVKPLVLPAFAHTSELAVITLVWSVPIAIAVGVAVARRGGPIDRGLFVVMTVLAALPEFVVGLTVMIALAVQLRWFPVASNAIGLGTPAEQVKAFVLPSLTLGVGVVPYIWRITRASVLESLSAPYTRAAVLRGLRRHRVIWRHAFRSAAVPLVNAIAINIIYLMGGVIIVENVFAVPGLGRLLLAAIAQGDSHTALAIIVLLGAVFVILGLLADVVVTYLNPRLRGSAR
ncbi:ABC transporter permease [Nocardioides pocheonensis]|uniref:ABC transporter permease n=1 Tax=Nocardioides pocheonensis TaxID=661485 RepID=A0A3N0GIM6_9ACTN|nr:ABC transporter permease [Nocardioides pocheonensis]